ncbi:MAG: MATE family efflux transporter [Deltaproteobacteria bacterium]|jgi:multidrug resistance protein, MATE family|nr:MATE family efflux transporter [Deltaproteobacteria bacterium]
MVTETNQLAQRRRFVRLAIPNIFAAVLVPVAGLVDMAMLGHLDSITHLAGVALASVLFDYLYWSFGFLRMVTTGLTAQSLGANDFIAVDRVLWRGLFVAASLALLIVLFQSSIADLGFWMLRGEAGVEFSGREYFDARILGAPAVLFNYVLIGWLLGRERSKDALVLSAVGNGMNIVLDYWFIYELNLASAGAGWATALSQYIMLAMGIVMMARLGKSAPLKIVFSEFWDRQAWKRLFGLNGDMMVRTIALQTAFAVFTNGSALLGTGILVANAVLLKVLSIASFFIDGYAYATESLAGIYAGSGDKKNLKSLLTLTMWASEITGIILVTAFVAFPNTMFGVMTDHQMILDTVGQYMYWLYPVVGLGALAYALDGYFIGLTLSGPMRRSMLFAVASFLLLAGLAAMLENNHVLWAAWSAFMGVRLVTLWRQAPATWS